MTHGETGQAKAEPAEPLGLYVHVPFCASTCDFCAFYQTVPTASDVRQFREGIARERDLVGWLRPVTTVFWGGGTPGLLAPTELGRLGQLLGDLLGGRAPVEWTVELAPASVTPARLAVLKEIGVTRISLGVQTFQIPLLEALGRRHNPTQIFRAYERIRAANFASLNLDLMFALPGQDEAQWLEDVEKAVALEPDHLSTYCLTLEEDTALWLRLSGGRERHDPAREAALYELTWDRMESLGYAQYEVSNFARPGHVCRHNLNTWRMGEWVGLGPSAASQFDGWRGANPADLQAWVQGVASGERQTEDRMQLTPALLAEDALVFGLRMNAGVDLAEWRERCPAAPWAAVDDRLDRSVNDGLVERKEGRIRLTRRGRLLADAVGVDLMEAFSGKTVAG